MGVSSSVLSFYVLGALLIVASAGDHAQAQQDFYQGKQVEIIVGHEAGGAYDVYARVLARHMAAHIPGNPNIIVQNAPGASGLTLANTLYKATPKDGLTFGIFDRDNVIEPLRGTMAARFDASKLTAIGSIGKQVATCAAWYQAPVKTIQDAMKTELLLGDSGPANTSYPLLLNYVFKTKFKIVNGYEGSSQIMLAIERGEVQGTCFAWETIKALRPDLVRDKKLIPLVQISFSSHQDLAGVPLLSDLVHTDADRQTLDFIVAPDEFGRPFFAPPDIPTERRDILRRALDATMADPEFLADAEKAKMEVDPMTGEAMQEMIEKVYATPPEIIKKVVEATSAFRGTNSQ
jgi:tripartite-type tricarboxylate transporter receptor subunit TctC